jgi:hypothetical protein
MSFKSTQGTDSGKLTQVFRSIRTVLGQRVGKSSSAIKIASGGNVRFYDSTPDSRTYHVFLQSGTFTASGPLLVDVLLVGGGAGSAGQGGGGGGGVLVKTNFTVSEGSYPIVVGSGGAASGGGYDTTAFGLIAWGGGPGIPIGSPRGDRGGSGSASAPVGGTGTNPTTPAPLGGPFSAAETQGYDGGINRPGPGVGDGGGGGGGGAGAAGGSAFFNSGAAGGAGRTVPEFPGAIVNPLLSGVSGGVYGGGGGGGSNPPSGGGDWVAGPAPGGAGGGGGGTKKTNASNLYGPELPATPGTNYLGGGGGGGTSTTGGPGVVMVRYTAQ